MPLRKSSFPINLPVTMQNGKGVAVALIKCEFVQDLLLVQTIKRAESTATEEVSQNCDP